MALPSAHRLKRHKDFQAVYGSGRRFYSKNFIVFALPPENLPEGPPPWRIGMAVTRKTGNAVIRNRVKRVLREFFRLQGSVLPAGFDFVVTPKKGLDPGLVNLNFAGRELMPVLKSIAGAYKTPA